MLRTVFDKAVASGLDSSQARSQATINVLHRGVLAAERSVLLWTLPGVEDCVSL